MKTLKTKGITGWMIAGAVVILMSYIAVIAAAPSPDYEKAVKNDITQIKQDENAVALHKQQLRQRKDEGDEAGAIAAKTELCKAKADLRRSKAYLKADKHALVQTHNTEMQPTAYALKENKRDLCAAKRQLKKDMRQGNTSALVNDVQLVVQKQKAVDRSEAKLNRQEQVLNDRLAAIDQQLEEPKGKNNEDQEKFAWNATASTEKAYFEAKEPVSNLGTAVNEK